MASDRDKNEGKVPKKKVVRKKKVAKKTKALDIKKISTADLYSLYLFVINDANNRGFGVTSPGARSIIRDKQKAIEEEFYLRAYGYNPFQEHRVVVEGMKPEDVDLDRFVVTRGPNKEPTDEQPDTFIVVKN